MGADRLYDGTTAARRENWLALGSGVAPLLYRGTTGHWPGVPIGFTGTSRERPIRRV